MPEPDTREWKVAATFEDSSVVECSVDTENEVVFFRRDGGPEVAVSLACFRDILDHLEDPCLICKSGAVDSLDLRDLAYIKLACGTCRTVFSVCLGELHIHSLANTPRHLRRRGFARKFIRQRRAQGYNI